MDIDILDGGNLVNFKVKKAKRPRQKSNPASQSVDLGTRNKAGNDRASPSMKKKPTWKISREDKRDIHLIT